MPELNCHVFIRHLILDMTLAQIAETQGFRSTLKTIFQGAFFVWIFPGEKHALRFSSKQLILKEKSIIRFFLLAPKGKGQAKSLAFSKGGE